MTAADETDPDIDAWEQLVHHAASLGDRKPGKRWQERGEELLARLPADEFGHRLVELLGTLPSEEAVGLRGLTALSSVANPTEPLLAALRFTAERCFRRAPDRGPVHQSMGTLCVKALAAHGPHGAAQLEALLPRVYYQSIRERIDGLLDEMCGDLGLSRGELAELMVPDLGLNRLGGRTVAIEDCAAELRTRGDGSVEVRWRAPSGRLQRTPPAKLRRSAPAEVREVGALAREIRRMVAVQRDRIELSFREQRSWDFTAWRVHYMEHPVVAPIARRLIWRVQVGGGSKLAVEHAGRLMDATGTPVGPIDDGRVSLWHPLESNTETVRSWRTFVEDRFTKQPFKQAHRETFLPTEEEEGPDRHLSTRFAGHVVRQQQFAALCRARKWEYTLQGNFSSGREARLDLPRFEMRATLEVPRLEPSNPASAVDQFVQIGGLRFAASDGRPRALAEVPPRLYSEIMRDVSLFVTVANVADTPAWEAAPEFLRRYYRDAAFSRLSVLGRIRRDFLERRLGSLPHSEHLSLDDRALVVRGDKHDYRIHLDNTQVLVAPDGPLVTVPEATRRRARREIDESLPFDDRTLSTVLGLVEVLVNDSEIEDAFVRLQVP